MILKKLKLENFIIYSFVDLDFSNVSLATIVGRHSSDRRRSNGSGKTALLESIRFALYGECRSSTKNKIIKSGEKSCLVFLECEVGSKILSIWRSVNSDGISSCKINIDGRFAGDKVRVANESIQSLLGIDVDLFDSIYFFKQGDQFGFAEKSPSERKDALAKVFKMDTLQRCLDLAKLKKKKREEEATANLAILENSQLQARSMQTVQSLESSCDELRDEYVINYQILDHYRNFHDDCVIDFSDHQKSNKEFKEEFDVSVNDLNEINSQIDIVNSRIVKSQQSLQRDNSTFERLKSEVESQKAIVAGLNKNELETSLPSLEIKRKTFEKECNAIVAKISKLEGGKDALKHSCIQSFDGSVCPTCKQSVNREHLDKIKLDQDEKISKYDSEISALKFQLQVKNKQKESLDAKYQNAMRDIAIIQQFLLKESEFKMKKSEFSQIQKSYDEDIKRRHDLCLKQNQLSSRTDIGKINKITKFIDDKMIFVKKALVEYDQKRLNQLQSVVDNCKQQFDLKVEQLKKRELIDKSIESLSKKKIEIDSSLLISEKIVEIFSKNGIQSIIIENLIGMIEAFANEILQQMQTSFILQLKTIKENKDGSLKESLDIIITDNGSEKNFENYSGGEKTMINIALRLSLSRVISAMHGVKVKTLFLDEVLGSLDVVNREEVVKIISYLSKSFDQVFVVSHTDEINDIIDSSIQITRLQDHSRVEIKHERNQEAFAANS